MPSPGHRWRESPRSYLKGQPPGEYRLRVRGTDNKFVRTVLSRIFGRLEDSYETNDTSGKRPSWKPAWLAEHIHRVTDKDWFVFQLDRVGKS
jgi:hypothetical protein